MIQLVGICKSYDGRQVLSDVNLTFSEGITCIMGPSGVGKTSLAYIVAGLVLPDFGRVIGVNDKQISVVFQEDRLLEWESAIDNLLFVKKDRKKAQQLLDEAGLEDSMHKKTSELSGGMKRRVCICRALIADYDILILDEPFKGLDAGLKPDIMQMVKDYSEGKIVICITHDLAEAEFFGRTIMLPTGIHHSPVPHKNQQMKD